MEGNLRSHMVSNIFVHSTGLENETRSQTKMQPHGSGSDRRTRLLNFELIVGELAQNKSGFSRINNSAEEYIQHLLEVAAGDISDMYLGSHNPNGPFPIANHACRSSGAEIRSCVLPYARENHNAYALARQCYTPRRPESMGSAPASPHAATARSSSSGKGTGATCAPHATRIRQCAAVWSKKAPRHSKMCKLELFPCKTPPKHTPRDQQPLQNSSSGASSTTPPGRAAGSRPLREHHPHPALQRPPLPPHVPAYYASPRCVNKRNR
jgi:hypothetical protein